MIVYSTHSLTHSLTHLHSLTRSPSLTISLTCKQKNVFLENKWSLKWSFTHCSLIHSPFTISHLIIKNIDKWKLKWSFTHSPFTYSLTHSLTHSPFTHQSLSITWKAKSIFQKHKWSLKWSFTHLITRSITHIHSLTHLITIGHLNIKNINHVSDHCVI